MEFELVPQRVGHHVGQPRFCTIINSNQGVKTCGSRVVLVPLEGKVTTVVVSKVSSEGYFTANTYAVVIRGDDNLDRSSVINIDRELIAQSRTTAVVGNLDSEEVRVVRSGERGLQRVAGSTRNVAVSESPLVRNRVVSRIIDVGNQNTVIVTNIADDRITRDLDSRVTVNDDGSVCSINAATSIIREVGHTIDISCGVAVNSQRAFKDSRAISTFDNHTVSCPRIGAAIQRVAMVVRNIEDNLTTATDRVTAFKVDHDCVKGVDSNRIVTSSIAQ